MCTAVSRPRGRLRPCIASRPPLPLLSPSPPLPSTLPLAGLRSPRPSLFSPRSPQPSPLPSLLPHPRTNPPGSAGGPPPSSSPPRTDHRRWALRPSLRRRQRRCEHIAAWGSEAPLGARLPRGGMAAPVVHTANEDRSFAVVAPITSGCGSMDDHPPTRPESPRAVVLKSARAVADQARHRDTASAANRAISTRRRRRYRYRCSWPTVRCQVVGQKRLFSSFGDCHTRAM